MRSVALVDPDEFWAISSQRFLDGARSSMALDAGVSVESVFSTQQMLLGFSQLVTELELSYDAPELQDAMARMLPDHAFP